MKTKTTKTQTSDFMVRYCPAGEKEWEARYFDTKEEAEAVRRGMELAKIPTLRVVQVRR